jgi:hypothetical protein
LVRCKKKNRLAKFLDDLTFFSEHKSPSPFKELKLFAIHFYLIRISANNRLFDLQPLALGRRFFIYLLCKRFLCGRNAQPIMNVILERFGSEKKNTFPIIIGCSIHKLIGIGCKEEILVILFYSLHQVVV